MSMPQEHAHCALQQFFFEKSYALKFNLMRKLLPHGSFVENSTLQNCHHFAILKTKLKLQNFKHCTAHWLYRFLEGKKISRS